jgi:hypothetical protein
MLNGRSLRPYHDAASGVEIADLSEQHEFTPGFRGIRVAQSWIFSVVFCKSLFVLLFVFIATFCRSLFAPFLMIIAWIVLQFTASDYPCVITKHVLSIVQDFCFPFCFLEQIHVTRRSEN